MKKRIITLMIIAGMIMGVLTLLFQYRIRANDGEDIIRNQLVLLKEMKAETEELGKEYNPELVENLNENIAEQKTMLQENLKGNTRAEKVCLVLYLCSIAFMAVLFGYVYHTILRPFEKMQNYAQELAMGNFDISLNYERSNYFGAFTWAFDQMRKEIVKARECEKNAIQNNKTVVAAISHDIKTPIASIRAYSEGLAANMDTDAEKKVHYINVIIKKCDEVVNLTNDLLLHSVTDLDKLKIEPKSVNIKEVLESVITDADRELYRIHMDDNIPSGMVMLDRRRFAQMLDNLISNSRKYAGTRIDIAGQILPGEYTITIRDYGSGIPDEDMPFVFGKFYRGRNAGSQQGSGLGLYITKYIIEQQNGSIKLYNHRDGLETIISFPLYLERI